MSSTKTPSGPGKKRRHQHVERAIAYNQGKGLGERRSLRLYYKKLNGRTVKRRIDPLALRGNTLVAFDHKRRAIRSFRMERVKHMEKSAFWAGFEKGANAAAELAGLGTLAVPSIAHFAGHDMSPDAQHALELGGLGILAAPYLHGAGKNLLARRAAAKAARPAAAALPRLAGAVPV